MNLPEFVAATLRVADDPLRAAVGGCKSIFIILTPHGAGEEGRAPSWVIRPSVSIMMRVSLMRPFSRRSMTIPQTRTGRPVAGIPRNSPEWVPVHSKRLATLSPSVICSRMEKTMSESPRAWREGYLSDHQVRDPGQAVEPAQPRLPRHSVLPSRFSPRVITSSAKRRMLVGLSRAIPFPSGLKPAIVAIVPVNSPGSHQPTRSGGDR